MAQAYNGDKPYIFISYSHKNSGLVLQIIENLQRQGYNVWFDAGIEAGTEWPEYIASHLKRAGCMVCFISNDYISSQNCRQEFLFAQNENKPILNVYIEKVQLPDGMRMQMGLNQAMNLNNYSSLLDFYNDLGRVKMFANCHANANPPGKQTQYHASQQQQPPVQQQPQPVSVAVPPKKKKKTWIYILVAIFVLCIFGAIVADSEGSGSSSGSSGSVTAADIEGYYYGTTSLEEDLENEIGSTVSGSYLYLEDGECTLAYDMTLTSGYYEEDVTVAMMGTYTESDGIISLSITSITYTTQSGTETESYYDSFDVEYVDGSLIDCSNNQTVFIK